MTKKTAQFRVQGLICCLLILLLSVIPAPGSRADTTPTNLLQNADFEQLTNGVPNNWYISSSQSAMVRSTTESVYGGLRGITLETAAAENPWILQKVPVEEGATYEVSTMFKALGITGDVGVRVDFYEGEDSGSTKYVGDVYKAKRTELDGTWRRFSAAFTPPAGAHYAFVYFRLFGKGKLYIDDTALVKTAESPELQAATDHVIYYSELTEAKVSIGVNPLDGVLTGKTVDVVVKDASSPSQVYYRQLGMQASAHSTVTFNPSSMTLQQPYTLQVSLKNAGGQLLSAVERTIYRWDRAADLPGSGPIRVSGQPFFPVVGYHVSIPEFSDMASIGVNTVQSPRTSNLNEMKQFLDQAQESGLKVTVILYFTSSNKTADITRFVTQLKTHPAVLAWMIMDEPTINQIPQRQLIELYTLVRSLDAQHPVYMVDSDRAAYVSSGQATDILVTDVYPYALPEPPIGRVGDWTRDAAAATGGLKPVWALLQVKRFPLHPANPTLGQVRNMAYQAVLAGAQGLGYYAMNDPDWKLANTDLWAGLADFKPEMDFIGRLVTQGNKLTESFGTRVRWGKWSLNGETYIVALNVSQTAQSAAIPLGDVPSRVELQYGGTPGAVANSGAQLDVQLAPEAALVYRVSSQ